VLLSHGEEEDYLSNQGKVPAGPPTPRSRGKAGTYFSKRPLVPLQIRLRRKLLLASGKPLSLRVAIPDRFSTTAGPVADNLHRRRDFACSLTTDKFFRSVAQHGFKIDWRTPPRPPKKSARDARPLVGEQAEQFTLEHLRMAKENAVRWVRSADSPPAEGEEDEHICPTFAIHQGDRWRSIFNMKWTNAFMRAHPFRMTGVKVLRDILEEGDFLVSIDLKDAYLNIRAHPTQTKYQRYVHEGQVWEIVTLPFGNALAPYGFSRFIKPLLKRWRNLHSLKALAWLDDIVLAHQDPCHLAHALQAILDDLSWAGLKVNPKPGKSTLFPTQDLIWVGIRWLTRSCSLQIPKEKMQRVRQEIRAMLQAARRKRKITAREVCRVLGRIQAMAEAIVPQRVYCRPILQDLHKALGKNMLYGAKVHLSKRTIAAMKWLAYNMHKWNGSSWAPVKQLHEIIVITDASPYGWGAILQVMDKNKKLFIELKTSGLFSTLEGECWQNEREALAVHLALRAFWSTLLEFAKTSSALTPLRVLILQDNASVVAYIRKQGGPKKALSVLIEEFTKECFNECIHLMSEWIPGVDMPADEWSRERALQDQEDWALSPSCFISICERLDFDPSLDLFASRLNNKCERYFSFRQDPNAVGTDALSDDKDWSRELAYANPPHNLITKVLKKLRQDKATVLLLVPDWPDGHWGQAFKNMVRSETLKIQLSEEDVLVGRGVNPLQLSIHWQAAILSPTP